MPRRDSGFTLLEILVAFAILSITLLALLQSMQTALGHERTAAAASARVLEAHSILDGVAAPAAGKRTGRLATGETWRIEIEPLETPAAAADGLSAWRVRLTVTDGDRALLSLVTVKLGS